MKAKKSYISSICLTDLEHMTLNFIKFIFGPEAMQNYDKTLLINLTCEFLAFENKNLSSTKNKWEISCPPLDTLTDSHFPYEIIYIKY
jgi:predicted lysophospholipase L1 biosynthesis ABC-type transport system permease subunit